VSGWADGAPPVLANPIDYPALRSRIQRMKEERHRWRGVADSPDGLVTATVNHRGCLLALYLDESIYRRPHAAALAESIIAAAHRATVNLTKA
jgi:DNA-binding protein YbaB